MDMLTRGAAQAGTLLVGWVLPLFVLCALLGLVQRIIERNLYRLLGTGGAVIVGIVGTPVHELSHALACLIGGHRIKRIALFRPDPRTGVLGYVEHTYDPGSFYQRVVGNFLIGIAPFFGGALALVAATALCAPDVFGRGLDARSLGTALSAGDFQGTIESVLGHAAAVAGSLLSAERLTDWRLYVYLFLVLSVGAHLAPSGPDWKGTRWPMAVLLLIFVLVVIALQPLGGVPESVNREVSVRLANLDAVLVFSLIVCSLAGGLLWVARVATRLLRRA